MGSYILCQVKRAENPYYIESIGLNIYSIEELCYYICQNLPLLDATILNERLAEWFKEELKLRRLAQKLLQLVQKEFTLGEFILPVLREINYLSNTEFRDLELKEESERLHRTAGNILKYLEENPGKIPQARQFIDYYQDTASQLLEKYVDLQNTGLNTEDTRRLKVQTEEAIRTLNEAFENQFQKLMSEELLDMEAELQLLRQTMKMEGHSTARQVNGGEKGGTREI